MDIDKILGKKTKMKNFSNLSMSGVFGKNPVSDIIGNMTKRPMQKLHPSPPKMQEMWKKMGPKQRQIARMKYKDTDGDRVPDIFDCQPKNVMRQDTFKGAIRPTSGTFDIYSPYSNLMYDPIEEAKKSLEAERRQKIISQQILTDNPVRVTIGDKDISFEEHEALVQQDGEDKFLVTTSMNASEKLEDLYERADVTLPLTNSGYEKWRKNIRTYDLEGVDTPDNIELIAEYESKMQIVQDRKAARTLESARKFIEDNPSYFEGKDRREATRLVAEAIEDGMDPTFIAQDIADADSDIELEESIKWNREEYE